MNELQIFNYKEASVRTAQIDGEPWFVLKDVCDVLGLTDTNKISTRLDQEELTRIRTLQRDSSFRQTGGKAFPQVGNV